MQFADLFNFALGIFVGIVLLKLWPKKLVKTETVEMKEITSLKYDTHFPISWQQKVNGEYLMNLTSMLIKQEAKKASYFNIEEGSYEIKLTVELNFQKKQEHLDAK